MPTEWNKDLAKDFEALADAKQRRECAWCGAEINGSFPNRRKEYFCSASHRAASNRAVRALIENNELRQRVEAAEAWGDAVRAALNPLRKHDPAQMLGRDTMNAQVVVDQIEAFRTKLAEAQQREAWWGEYAKLNYMRASVGGLFELPTADQKQWRELRRLLGLGNG